MSLKSFSIIILSLVLAPSLAAADPLEFSLGFSFNRSNYSNSNFTWSRRWGTSLGYYFSENAEVEIAFQDVLDRTKLTGFEDTTFHDRIYSANWVQSLSNRNFPIQPYVKLGLGQLNRDAQGSYALGLSPPARLDSLTVVMGAGLRLYFTRRFAIRSEATSYLTGGKISTWQDNIAVTAGASIIF